MKQIREGGKVIEAQLNTVESRSGLRDSLKKILDAAPTNFANHRILKSTWLDTPLGPMLAISDAQALYLLEFMEKRGLEREIECLRHKVKAAITPGRTAAINSIEEELARYFAGKLKEFETPIHILGSPFQKMVWLELIRMPYGETRSYLAQAKAIGKATSVRAVANANGANQLAIIIPCHRIINSNGEFGGYSGGINRKKWLLGHEKSN
jgi:AraC family transcriptional regulator of adaptative response/methylated-DNA-[protein]-cysteine methyltransferase